MFCVPNKKIICQGCLIIFILIGFVPNEAFAQSGLIDLIATDRNPARRRVTATVTTQTGHESARNAINGEIARQRGQITATERSIEALERELIPIARAVQDECPGVVYSYRRDGKDPVCRHTPDGGEESEVRISEESRTRYNEARRRQRAIDRELRSRRSDLETLKRDIEGLQNLTVGDVYQDGGVTNARVIQEATIETLDLRQKLSELGDDLEDIDTVLDEVERIYDRTVLGAYMQDKIGQLLNSQVICTARKRCATRDPQKIDSDVIQKELFPTSTQTRSDYYEKVERNRRGAR